MSTSTVTLSVGHSTVTATAEQYSSSAADDVRFQATARGDRSGTVKLQGIPNFSDLYTKRKWVKEHMAAVFRFFGKQGYHEGVAGHISMRGEYSLPSRTLGESRTSQRRLSFTNQV
jgi:hypothetical protein